MKAEIIAVGSELLLGQITNTNAKFISSQTWRKSVSMSITIRLSVTIQTRLEEVIEIARKRADILIFTGGLGPTKDDMTKETIVKHIGTTLVSDDEALHYIQQLF